MFLINHSTIEIVKEDSTEKLSQEASKYMNGQTCLICEIEFDSITEVAKHIKKEHLDIIIVMEKISEVAPQTKVKQEVINLDEENDKSTKEMSEPTEYENITFTFEAAGPKLEIVNE